MNVAVTLEIKSNGAYIPIYENNISIIIIQYSRFLFSQLFKRQLPCLLAIKMPFTAIFKSFSKNFKEPKKYVIIIVFETSI